MSIGKSNYWKIIHAKKTILEQYCIRYVSFLGMPSSSIRESSFCFMSWNRRQDVLLFQDAACRSVSSSVVRTFQVRTFQVKKKSEEMRIEVNR